jgi:hypothetical protein
MAGAAARMRPDFPQGVVREAVPGLLAGGRSSSLHRAATVGSRYFRLGLVGVVQIREVTEVVVVVTT